eukprot:3427120-Lingulodinium_polyedra.AAC.1
MHSVHVLPARKRNRLRPSVPSGVRRGTPGRRVPLEVPGPEECGPSWFRFGSSGGPAGAARHLCLQA